MSEYKDGHGDYYLAGRVRDKWPISNEARWDIIEALHAYHRVRERGNWIATLDHPVGGNRGACIGCDAEELVAAIEATAFMAGAELHDHDPDVCAECQEMVMEALRD